MTAGARLRVDPVACDGIGMCAHVAPELIRVDTWGFPIVTGELRHSRAVRSAGAAVAACPRRALFIEDGDPRR